MNIIKKEVILMLSLFTVVFSDDSTSLFCVNPTYYFQINYSFVWAHNFNNNCFHYSETSDQQGEITLTDNQINQIVSASDQLTQQPSTSYVEIYKGYSIGDQLQLYNKSNKSDGNNNFSQSSLRCNNSTIAIYYRMNGDFFCDSLFNRDQGLIGFFSFKSNSANLTDQNKFINFDFDKNETIIYIIIARQGSSQIEKIQKIQTQSNSNSNGSTLRFRFIDPQTDLQHEQQSPSFFPQIPYDIFYPIQQLYSSF